MKKIVATIALFSIVCVFSFVRSAFAKDYSLKELEEKIAELQGEEKTLANEIAYLEARVKYVELKISEAGRKVREKETELKELGEDVDSLISKIFSVGEALDKQEKILEQRVRARYKSDKSLSLELFLNSKGMDEVIDKIKYLKITEEQDHKMLAQLKDTKLNFTSQKVLLEEKKKQVEALKRQIEYEKAQSIGLQSELNEDKKAKEKLLEETQNDEAKYRDLLNKALAEITALNSSVGRGVEDGPVKKGDPIARFGNSGYPGCSTGAHLHFEIRKNNQWVNPEDYLEEKTVYDADNGYRNIGNGDWEWPLQSPIILTQDYGKTPYSWRYKYAGGIHTGFDMVSNASYAITAPADGVLYSTTEACGSSTIKIKYIVHDDETVSYYLHVQ